MDQTHKDALKCCQKQLVEEIIFEDLADAIISEKVFTATTMERIQAGDNRAEKVRRLLEDLPRRGPDAYHIFIECLTSTRQSHLAETILKKEEMLRKGEEESGDETEPKGDGVTHDDTTDKDNIEAEIVQTDPMAKLIDETNEQLDRYIKNERKLFVESPTFKQCQADCKTKRHTAIFGAPGDGKTIVGLELLCRVRDNTNGKAILLSIRNKEDWKRVDLHSSTGRELVILFDDMLGQFGLNENLKDFWISQLPKIDSFVQNGKMQVIITCRESIFCTAENELESFDLFNIKSRIHLSGPNCKYPLDEETKFNVIKKHIELGKNQQCRISVETMREISQKSYVGFMQMSKVFVSEKSYYSQGAMFFDRAADFLVEEINRLRSSRDEDEKYNFCALACVLVKQGLNVDQIDGDETVKEIAKCCICRIESSWILKSEIKKAVKRLTNTYLIKINDTYQFQHTSWLESVFKSFLESNPSLLIKYCKFGLIEDLITTKNARVKYAGLCELSNNQYESLFQRFVSEMVDRNVSRVFFHRCFTDAVFTQTFCAWLNSDRKRKQAVVMSWEPERYPWRGRERYPWWTLSGGDDTERSLLYWAARNSDVEFIVWAENALRKSGEWDMNLEMTAALLSACLGGNLPVCTWLLSHTETEVSDRCIVLAACSGNINVVNILLNLDKTFSCDVLSEGLCEACERGNIDVCKQILTQPSVDRGSYWGECLSLAAWCGNIDVVETLINYAQFTNNDLSRGLYKACVWGKYDVLRLLLGQPGVDKGESWGRCLSGAAKWGNIDVVETLMDHGQFTKDDLSLGLYEACVRCNINVCKAILIQPEVDKGDMWGLCLSAAAKRGNIDVVTTLMEYGQFTSDALSRGLYEACECGKFDVFKQLLTQSGADRGDMWGLCLRAAAERGNVHIVTTLMNYGYFTSDALSLGLYRACECGKFDVFRLILTQPGVDRSVWWGACLCLAAVWEKFYGDSRCSNLFRTKGYVIPGDNM